MKTLLIEGDKTFKITVPEDARITFGPWSPPNGADKYARNEGDRRGTLRIYSPGPKSTESILAVFSGVTSFRDVSIGYAEQVAREEGATIWKSDESGYSREEKVQRADAWVTPLLDNKPVRRVNNVKGKKGFQRKGALPDDDVERDVAF